MFVSVVLGSVFFYCYAKKFAGERLRNDLFCVEWVVKTFAQSQSEDVLLSSGELVGQSETAAGRCNSRSVRSNSRAAGGRSQQRRHPPQNWQVRGSRISVRTFVNVSCCEGQSSVSRRVGWATATGMT